MILLVVLVGSVCAVAETCKTRLWWLPGAALIAFAGVITALIQTSDRQARHDAMDLFAGVLVAFLEVVEIRGAIVLFALGALMLALAYVLRRRQKR